MKEFFDVVSNLGFPIGISCYLLFRFEKKLDALEDAVQELDNKVSENTKTIESCKGRKR